MLFWVYLLFNVIVPLLFRVLSFRLYIALLLILWAALRSNVFVYKLFTILPSLLILFAMITILYLYLCYRALKILISQTVICWFLIFLWLAFTILTLWIFPRLVFKLTLGLLRLNLSFSAFDGVKLMLHPMHKLFPLSLPLIPPLFYFLAFLLIIANLIISSKWLWFDRRWLWLHFLLKIITFYIFQI